MSIMMLFAGSGSRVCTRVDDERWLRRVALLR